MRLLIIGDMKTAGLYLILMEYWLQERMRMEQLELVLKVVQMTQLVTTTILLTLKMIRVHTLTSTLIVMEIVLTIQTVIMYVMS